MAMRLAKQQATTFQQEKMASLGTVAAGLMHELNNPGSAARACAAGQLRQNFERMHRLTATWATEDLTKVQKRCMFELQDKALNSPRNLALSTLEQSDAEEQFAEWMESANIQEAWSLAPTFVSIGLKADDLSCARSLFDDQMLSNSLSWLEALVSSMQLVGTIEESVTRVTDLVKAVKSYAYEGRRPPEDRHQRQHPRDAGHPRAQDSREATGDAQGFRRQPAAAPDRVPGLESDLDEPA